MADDGLFVTTSHVVPLETILVEVVEDGNASFVPLLAVIISVVRLSSLKEPGVTPLAMIAAVLEWIRNPDL